MLLRKIIDPSVLIGLYSLCEIYLDSTSNNKGFSKLPLSVNSNYHIYVYYVKECINDSRQDNNFTEIYVPLGNGKFSIENGKMLTFSPGDVFYVKSKLNVCLDTIYPMYLLILNQKVSGKVCLLTNLNNVIKNVESLTSRGVVDIWKQDVDYWETFIATGGSGDVRHYSYLLDLADTDIERDMMIHFDDDLAIRDALSMGRSDVVEYLIQHGATIYSK